MVQYLSWSQSGFYQESIRSLPGVHTLYQESSRSPSGVHQESIRSIKTSDVLAWLGLEANGFGLALSGFGFQDPQAKP